MHSRWNGSRRSGHWLTERWPIAAALLLVGMAALFAAPAQAATVTLVSNFGSVGNNAHVVGDLKCQRYQNPGPEVHHGSEHERIHPGVVEVQGRRL